MSDSIRSDHRVLRAAALALAVGLTALPLAAQRPAPAVSGAKPPPPAKPDPEVKTGLERLRAIVDDKSFAGDAGAPGILADLVARHRAGMHEHDEKAVLAALGQLLVHGPQRPPEQPVLYESTIAALGQFGREAGKPLMNAWRDEDRFPDKPQWRPLRIALLRGVGEARSDDSVDFLLDVAQRHFDSAQQAAAGEALGRYADAKESVRKDIVEGLIKQLGSIHSRAAPIDSADIQAQNARERLTVLEPKWTATLQALTGQKLDTFGEWQRWLNKNRTKRWR